MLTAAGHEHRAWRWQYGNGCPGCRDAKRAFALARRAVTRRRDGRRTATGFERTPEAVAERRRKVAAFWREGRTAQWIALRMDLTERTVERHLAAVRAAEEGT